jgi:hypothetical protein
VAYAKEKHPQLAAAVTNVHDFATGKKGAVDAYKSAKESFGSAEKRKGMVSSAKDIVGSTVKKARVEGEKAFNEHSKKVMGGGGSHSSIV